VCRCIVDKISLVARRDVDDPFSVRFTVPIGESEKLPVVEEKEVKASDRSQGSSDIVQQTQHIFLFASDGTDTVTSNRAKIEARINAIGAKLRAAGLASLFLVVGIGSGSDTSIGMVAKRALQTMASEAGDTVHYCAQPDQIPAVVKKLSDAQEEQRHALLVKVEIASTSGGAVANTDGFSNASLAPTAKCSTSLVARLPYNVNDMCIFLRGDPATYNFRLNGKPLSVMPLPSSPTGSSVILPVLLQAIDKLSQEIRIAHVAGQDTSGDLNMVSSLVKAIKSRSFNFTDLRSADPQARITMMRLVKGKVVDLESSLNQLRDHVASTKNASSAAQAAFLQAADQYKFGSKALRRAQPAIEATAILTSTKTMFERGAEADKKNNNKPITSSAERQSFLSAMNESEHLEQLRALTDASSSSLSILDMIYGYGQVGQLIRIKPSEAAIVDPWKINVEYVSADCGDSASSMCSLDAGHQLRDLRGEIVQDVLVLLNPRLVPVSNQPSWSFMKTDLYNVLLSLTFTRNLELCMPSQRIAILVNALTRSIAQLNVPATCTSRHIENIFDILYTLRVQYGNRLGITDSSSSSSSSATPVMSTAKKVATAITGEGKEEKSVAPVTTTIEEEKPLAMSQWNKWIASMLSSEVTSVGQYLTESEAIQMQSIGQVIAALCCCYPTDSATPTPSLNRVMIAILAESFSRMARIHVKRNITAAVAAGGGGAAPVAPGGATTATNDDDVTNAHLQTMFGINAGTEKPLRDNEVEMKQDEVKAALSFDYDRRTLAQSTAEFIHQYRENFDNTIAALRFVSLLRNQLATSFVTKEKKDTPSKTPATPADWWMSIVSNQDKDSVTKKEQMYKQIQAEFGTPSSDRLSEFIFSCMPPQTEVDNKESKDRYGTSAEFVTGALVAQGIRYHTSRERRDGLPPLSDQLSAHRVIAELVHEQRYVLYESRVAAIRRQIALEMATKRAIERKAMEAQLAATFFTTHHGMYCCCFYVRMYMTFSASSFCVISMRRYAHIFYSSNGQ
jgi:hypothetical protein